MATQCTIWYVEQLINQNSKSKVDRKTKKMKLLRQRSAFNPARAMKKSMCFSFINVTSITQRAFAEYYRKKRGTCSCVRNAVLTAHGPFNSHQKHKETSLWKWWQPMLFECLLETRSSRKWQKRLRCWAKQVCTNS